MTSIIPNGYSQGTLTFTTTGGTRIYQTTCGFLPQISLTAAQQNVAMRGALLAAGKVLAATNMFIGFTCAETKILYRNLGGILLSDIDTTPVIGSKSGNPLPVNTSVIVRKVTAFAGKQYRGRFLVPPVYFDESAVNGTGQVIGGVAPTYAGLWNTALTDLVNAGMQPVLLHDTVLTPTPITAFASQSRIGTIGKRLRP